MAYSEQNGQVVLTMSKEDYGIILRALGSFTASVAAYGLAEHLDDYLALLNRLNSGNPHYTPYQTGEAKK